MSLINLAYDLSANCQTVTEQYYISLWTGNAVDEFDREARIEIARAKFINHFGGATKKHLDPEVIKADIGALEAIADASSGYIDRRLAHLDQREPDGIPTLQELDTWCEALNAKLKKFYLLLYCVDLEIPTVLQHDWLAILKSVMMPLRCSSLNSWSCTIAVRDFQPDRISSKIAGSTPKTTSEYICKKRR